MEITNKHPKIYLLSGKARNGKDTTAEFLKKFYEADGKKVIYSRAGKYIKFYASEMTGWDGKEETKPRQLLQELGTDVIRNKLNKADMLIERQLDDIEIYSYFYDAIIVPQNLPAPFFEFSFFHFYYFLDNYTNFDYEVTNDTLEQLEKDIYKIYKEETK